MTSVEMTSNEQRVKYAAEQMHTDTVSSNTGINGKKEHNLLHPALVKMLQCQLMMSVLVAVLVLPVGLISAYFLVKAQQLFQSGEMNKGMKYLKVSRILSCGGLVFFMVVALTVLTFFILIQLGTIHSSLFPDKPVAVDAQTTPVKDDAITINALDVLRKLSATKVNDSRNNMKGRKNLLGLKEDYSGDHD